MTIRLAVVRVTPLVALGLGQALARSGYDIEAVDDPISWVRVHPDGVMLIGTDGGDQLRLLRSISAVQRSPALVALLASWSSEQVQICLGSGAAGCVSSDWPTDRVVLGVDAATRGMTLLPVSLARDLANRQLNCDVAGKLTQKQVSWVKSLASGMTVHELAAEVGYSERETYRRLRQIYTALGVRGRTEALMLASRSGIMDAVGG